MHFNSEGKMAKLQLSQQVIVERYHSAKINLFHDQPDSLPLDQSCRTIECSVKGDSTTKIGAQPIAPIRRNLDSPVWFEALTRFETFEDLSIPGTMQSNRVNIRQGELLGWAIIRLGLSD